MKPWEQEYSATSEGVPWETNSFNKPAYAPLQADKGATSEKILDQGTGETFDAPIGTADFLSSIQNDDTWDAPASTGQELDANFQKMQANLALVFAANDLISDEQAAEFIADRSLALQKVQENQPEYVNRFFEKWNGSGVFGKAAAVFTEPRAVGRQIVTQTPHAVVPVLMTWGGAKTGGFTGAKIGAGGAVVAGQLGPQAAAPEEIVTVPVASTIGAGIGSFIGGVGGAFEGTKMMGTAETLDEIMSQEYNVDMTNAESILNVLSNQEAMDDIHARAQQAGADMAKVDALFQVFGGYFLKRVAKGGGGIAKKAAAGAADVSTQAAGETLGEAARQYSAFENVNWDEALLEGVTSIGQSAGQTAVGATIQGVPKTADVAKTKVAEARAKFDAVEVVDEATTADADTFNADITAAENDIIGAIAENQIIELENQQQAEIVTEAEGLKAQIDAIPNVDVNKPSTFKKVIGYTPETISQFIKKSGGIVDKAGELAARDVNTKSGVGIIRKDTSQGDQASLDGSQPSVPDNANIDFIKERVFDAGFFPDKTDYNEISDSELFDAIAADINGDRVYKGEDLAQIAEITQGTETAEADFARRGIDRAMSVEQIADVIREERNLGKFTPRELIEIKPVAELKSADDQFVKDVQDVKVRSYGFLSGKMLDNVSEFGRDFGLGLERLLTPISSRVRNISVPLFMRLRKFEFDVKTQTIADNQAIKPFLIKLRDLDAETTIALDLALKNGNKEIALEIAEANNMVAEVEAVQTTLDEIFDRAKEAGMDIEYRSDFFPRRVNDVEGLIDHFKGSEFWNVIQEAIRAKETKMDKTLTDEERVVVINNLMRGFKVEGVSLAQKGIFKERTIDKITPKLNEFYETSDQALIAYISIANDAIETSRLFGKAVDIEGNRDLTESVGAFVNEISDKGQITTRQASVLKEILNARFNDQKMGWITAAVRDLSYIDTMGSPLNAITQFGDLATSAYNAGVVNSVKTLPKAALNDVQISLDDIGIDQIYEEFRNSSMTSEAVNTVFKFTGLSKIDQVGKLTLVNSTLKKAQAKAKKGDAKFLAELETMFEDDAPRVLQDFKDGKITEDVKFYAFNTLLDFQPVAKSEMPEYYLRSGNLKILYMLKTFTIRQLDIYRREGIAKMNEGVRTGDKKLAAEGLTNFVRLAGFWITMGASADFMKDLLRSLFGGSEVEDPEDYVVDNILKAFGFSRYQANMVAKEGPTEVAGEIFLPPDKFFTNVFKDYKKAKKGELTLDNSKTIRSIPVGGELYYFWWGGGSDGSSDNKQKSNLLSR